ncbi:MAG: hypothetical protein ACFFAS_10275 [Promethearchaeota archaeon]
MKKKTIMSFKILKMKGKDGQTTYGLELSTEDGNVISTTPFSTIEKLVDGIYDYFDEDLYYS